jgi:hypothetical protein
MEQLDRLLEDIQASDPKDRPLHSISMNQKMLRALMHRIGADDTIPDNCTLYGIPVFIDDHMEDGLIMRWYENPVSLATRLINKYGWRYEDLPDQDEEVDLLTGKRIWEED